MSNLGILPPDIIRLIVKQVDITDLHACTLINKSFFMVSNPLLWRSIRFNTQPPFLNFIASLFESPQQQRSLGQYIREFDTNQFMTNSTLIFLLSHVPCLTKLGLIDAKHITDDSFQHVPRYCPKLKLLTLWRTFITAPTLTSVCQQLPHLHALVLTGPCSGLPPDIFSTLATNQLDDIRIGPRWRMTQQTVLDLTRFDTLTILSIIGQQQDILHHLLTTTSTSSTGNVPWPHLTQLQIGDNNNNDDDDNSGGSNMDMEQALISFIKSHLCLKKLLLMGNKFTDLTLNVIGTCLPRVFVALTVYGNNRMTIGGIRRLVQHCGVLKFILLQRCKSLKQGFPELDHGGIYLKHYHSTWMNIGQNTIKKIQQKSTPSLSDINGKDIQQQ